MRKTTFLLALLVIAVVVPLAGNGPSACGDKFLATGRNSPDGNSLGLFQPATILIYAGPASVLSSEAEKTDLQETLDHAGHTYTAVEDKDALVRELATGRYQVVLADLSDVPSIQEAVDSSPAKPIILPLLHEPSREEMKSAKKKYRNVISYPARGRYIQAVIDRAVAAQGEKSGQGR